MANHLKGQSMATRILFPSSIIRTLGIMAMLVAMITGLAAATLAAQSTGGGVGPYGNEGGSPTYAGPGPTGEVDVLWELEVPAEYRPGSPVAVGNQVFLTATSE